MFKYFKHGNLWYLHIDNEVFVYTETEINHLIWWHSIKQKISQLISI